MIDDKIKIIPYVKKNVLEHVLVFVLVCLWQRVDTKGIIRFQLQYKDDKRCFIGIKGALSGVQVNTPDQVHDVIYIYTI